MNGKVIYRNLMSILMLGVNSIMEQRTGQLYGPALEDAVSLCLQIFLLALSKDSIFAEAWRPIYQACCSTFCMWRRYDLHYYTWLLSGFSYEHPHANET